MTVIIPHPDDQLKIVKYQKDLLTQLIAGSIQGESSGPCFRKPPVWIPLPSQFASSSKEELKRIDINRVEIHAPEVCSGRLVSKVVIETAGGTVETEYVHLWGMKENASLPDNDSGEKKILTFPMNIRIFRLGIAETLSENTSAISESIWKKISHCPA